MPSSSPRTPQQGHRIVGAHGLRAGIEARAARYGSARDRWCPESTPMTRTLPMSSICSLFSRIVPSIGRQGPLVAGLAAVAHVHLLELHAAVLGALADRLRVQAVQRPPVGAGLGELRRRGPRSRAPADSRRRRRSSARLRRCCPSSAEPTTTAMTMRVVRPRRNMSGVRARDAVIAAALRAASR